MKDIVRDRAWLHGTILSAVAYGMNAVLFVLSFHLLLRRSRAEKAQDGHPSRQTVVLLAYSFITFALATLCVAPEVDMVDVAFIERTGQAKKVGHIESPADFEARNFGVTPISLTANVAFSVLNWFVDALLLWRYRVIYRNSTASPLLLTAIPIGLLVGSFVSGVIYLERLTDHDASPFSRNITFILIYGLIFLSFNLILTFLIVFRLILYRKRITTLVGSHYADHYTSVASILIESALIMDVMLFLALVPLILRSPLVTIPLLVLPQIQAIASFLIVYRVAQGTAWLSGTANDLIAQHSGGTTAEGNLSAARFRVTSQMTQASTALNFNHVQSVNFLCPIATRSKADHLPKAESNDDGCQCEEARETGTTSDSLNIGNSC